METKQNQTQTQPKIKPNKRERRAMHFEASFEKAKLKLQQIEYNKRMGISKPYEEFERQRCQAKIDAHFLYLKQKAEREQLAHRNKLGSITSTLTGTLSGKGGTETETSNSLSVNKTKTSSSITAPKTETLSSTNVPNYQTSSSLSAPYTNLENKPLNLEEERELEKEAANKLCLALACSKDGCLKPVDPVHWPLVDAKVREVIMQKLLDSKHNLIPRFQRGSIYKGFVLINCNDEYTKEMLNNCMCKLGNLIEGINLQVIRASRINKFLKRNEERQSNSTLANDNNNPVAVKEIKKEELKTNNQPNKEKELAVCKVVSRNTLKVEHQLIERPQPTEKDKNRYRNAQRLLQFLLSLPQRMNENHKNKKQEMENIITEFEKRFLNKSFSQTDVKKETISQNEFSDHFPKQKLERVANTNKQANNSQLSVSNERQTSRENRSSLNEMAPQPSQPSTNWWHDTDNYPTTSRRSYNFETKSDGKRDFSSIDSVEDCSNDLVRYYPSEDASEGLLVSKRAYEHELQLNAQYSQNVNEFNELNRERPQSSSFYENYYSPENESFSESNFNNMQQHQQMTETAPIFETQNFYSQPDDMFSSGNDQFYRMNESAFENYDPYNEDRFRERRPEGSQYSNNFENFIAPGSSSVEFPGNSSQRYLEWGANEYSTNCTDFQEQRNNANQQQFTRQEENDFSASYTDFAGPNETDLQNQIYKFLISSDANVTPVAALKRKLESLRNHGSNEPENEVITLSDDSDVEEVPVIDVNRAKSEYSKAVESFRKMSMRNKNSFSDAEKLQIEICRHKINKYGKILKSTAEKTDTKRPPDNTSSTAKRSRNEPPTTSRQPTKHDNTSNREQTGFWKSGRECLSNPKPDFQPTNTSTDTIQRQPAPDNSDLQIAIIDRNNEEFKIHEECWKQIQKLLLEHLAQEMERTGNTNIGMFDSMYWKHGIKIIQCENMESLNFIKRFIYKQDMIWTTKRLDVVPVRDLPRRSVVKVTIAAPNLDDKAVLKILKAQNYSLYSGDWTLLNSRESINKKNKDYFISISATSLERLILKKGAIRYGINNLKMVFPDGTLLQ